MSTTASPVRPIIVTAPIAGGAPAALSKPGYSASSGETQAASQKPATAGMLCFEPIGWRRRQDRRVPRRRPSVSATAPSGNGRCRYSPPALPSEPNSGRGQLRPPPPCPHAFDGNRQRLPLQDKDHEAFAS